LESYLRNFIELFLHKQVALGLMLRCLHECHAFVYQGVNDVSGDI